MKKYPNSNFVVDARNGFEDEKEDVEWGFSVLLPAMSKTDCKNVLFIMKEVNEIEEEMEMWTKEFMKYFTVKKFKCYEDSMKFLSGQRGQNISELSRNFLTKRIQKWSNMKC